MAAKAISEFDAKRLVSEHIKSDVLQNKFLAIPVDGSTNLESVLQANQWAQSEVRYYLKYSKFRLIGKIVKKIFPIRRNLQFRKEGRVYKDGR